MGGYYCGAYPIALLGKLLAKNTTLEELYINAKDVLDYECFNELGRGLLKNKSLKIMDLILSFDSLRSGISLLPEWVETRGNGPEEGFKKEPVVCRPLPHRPQGSTTCDFSVLEQAILQSNLTMMRISATNLIHHRTLMPSLNALICMFERLNKPGLVVVVGG